MNREQALQNSLAIAVDEYKKLADSTNPELELKVNIGDSVHDRDIFMKLLAYARAKFGEPVIERTGNVLSSNIYSKEKDKATYIRQMTFDETAKKTGDTYYKKTRVMGVNMSGFLPYKVAVSTEIPSEPFKASTTCIIRLRLRYVFSARDETSRRTDGSPDVSPDRTDGSPTADPGNHPWRYDFTVVRELPCNKISDIGLVAKQLFVLRGNEVPHGKYEAELEYVGDRAVATAADLMVIDDVFSALDTNFQTNRNIQSAIHFAASHIIDNPAIIPSFQRNVSLKRLLKQAIAITKQMYSEIFPPLKYFVSKKLDGNRALVVINDGKIQVVSDKYYEFPTTETGVTVLDAELVYGPGKTFMLYILDVLVLKNDPIHTRKFADRYVEFGAAADLLSRYKVPIQPKKFIEVTEDVEQSIRLAMEAHPGVEDDGIIFNSHSEPYASMNIYKWKPPGKNTIDFLVRRCPPNLLGVYPYTKSGDDDNLYFLFSGIDINMFASLGMSYVPGYRDLFGEKGKYFPIQFSPSDYPLAYIFHSERNDLDGKIIELIWRQTDECRARQLLAEKAQEKQITNCWDLVRVRDDREIEDVDFGNNFRVAEIIWQNYSDPFTAEDLWNPIKSYFTKTRSNIYEAANSFNAYVKAKLIEKYAKNAEYAVDLASGRGADLKKYLMSGVRNALFVEYDKSALAELNRRKYDILNIANKTRGDKPRLVMSIATMHADLNEKHEYLTAAVTNMAFPPADSVFIHFAIHYMMTTKEAYTNFLAFVRSIMKPDGTFTFTCFNGGKIFDLLKDKAVGESWISVVPGTADPKFAIERRFAGSTFQKYGQEIAVKMAFSNEMIPETLVNIDEAIKDAKKCGFDLVERGSFADYVDRLSVDNARLARMFGEDDKHYDGLYEFVTLRLKRVGGRKKK